MTIDFETIILGIALVGTVIQFCLAAVESKRTYGAAFAHLRAKEQLLAEGPRLNVMRRLATVAP